MKRIHLRLAASLLCLILAVDAIAQDGLWETHTAFRQTRDVVVLDDAVWAATGGGVYRYDLATGERTRMTVVEGLHGVDARALDYDAARGVLWVGYVDGVFDRIDVETGRVRTFFDVRRAERFPSRGIVGLDVAGDSVYVLTDFGIVLFDARPAALEVRATYSQLGLSATVGVRVNDLIHADFDGRHSLIAATADGVAVAPTNAVNLQDPSAWTLLPSAGGAGEVLSVTVRDGRLYAGARGGLYTVDSGGAFTRLYGGADVRSLRTTGDDIVGVDQFAVLRIGRDEQVVRTPVEGFESPAVLVPDGDRVWLGDRASGVGAIDLAQLNGEAAQPSVTDVMPGGPYHGQFSMLHVDRLGRLWASGVEEGGTGVYRRGTDGQWTSFVAANYDEMRGRSAFLVLDTDEQGNMWAGSHGHAMIRIDTDDNIEIFNQENSALTSIPGDPNYVVVRGVGVDPAGNVWASNVFGRTQLVVRSADGEWTAVQPSCPDYPLSGNVLHRVVIDSYGNKWFIVVSESNLRQVRGLMVYDSGPTFGAGDDACRYFRSEGGAGQGLPSTVVNGVAEDRDGRIWIATNSGPAFTPNSRLMPQSSGEVFIWPQPADRSLGNFLLFGVRINAVAVDAANRIWLGTENQGVYAVRDSPQGGFEVVAHFTAENSPLLSSTIGAIAADGRTGTVYFATDRGLISYQAGALEPADRAGDLRIYPNPVRIEDDQAPLVRIEGLVEATELRIVTASGELVQRIATRGGQATWDGRDLDGRLVRSGMYLVIAVGNAGEGRSVGKVAIIR